MQISQWMYLLMGIILLGGGSKVNAQMNLATSDSLAIVQAIDAQQHAWNEGNVETFMEGYWHSDRLVFVGANGPTYGYDPVKADYYRRYPDRAAMGRLAFTIIDLYAIDVKTAFVIGKFHLTRKTSDVEGHFTLVWKKFDDQWLIISDHTSVQN